MAQASILRMASDSTDSATHWASPTQPGPQTRSTDFLQAQTEDQGPGLATGSATGSRKAQSPMMPKCSLPPRVGSGFWLPWPGLGAQNRQPWLEGFLWLWPWGQEAAAAQLGPGRNEASLEGSNCSSPTYGGWLPQPPPLTFLNKSGHASRGARSLGACAL